MLDSIHQQALLYACGELDADEVVEFEELLSAEQPVREALVAAMSMVAPSSPLYPGNPDRAYRARVRSRLLGPRAGAPSMLGRHLAWALGGAAAAVLTMLLLNPPHPNPPPGMPAASTTPAPAVIPAARTTAENIYSDLSNVDRVFRVHDEQQHRRSRFDDLKLPHGLLEDPPAGKGSSM